MQQIILGNKNRITLLSALLIALAFMAKWASGNETVFIGALVVASMVGVLPIAIQAYQALRVKVVSIDVLVLGCPGALVIGVPVSNVSGIGNGARNGVLLKGSEVMVDFSKVDSILFDKTGTLTLGNPSVAETVHYSDDHDETLRYLASVEHESDHPLAKAVLQEIGEVDYLPISRTDVVKGGGIVAEVQGRRVAVGIAMGGGTDVAIETSDVVLMNSDISRLPHALGLTKATVRNMKQNIVIAVGVVLILFAGLFFGNWVNMSIGMLVHEASILVVILNGMRLMWFRMHGERSNTATHRLARVKKTVKNAA